MRKLFSKLPSLCLLGILCSFSSSAFAHKLKLFLSVEGRYVSGQTYFINDGPPPGTTIKLLDAQNRTITQILSDADGYFRLPLPERGEVMVEADAGAGHSDHVHLTPQPTVSQTTPIDDDMSPSQRLDFGIIQHQLDNLHEQLQQHDQRTRLFDIFGGLGYILAILFGLLLWRHHNRR